MLYRSLGATLDSALFQWLGQLACNGGMNGIAVARANSAILGQLQNALDRLGRLSLVATGLDGHNLGVGDEGIASEQVVTDAKGHTTGVVPWRGKNLRSETLV